MIYYLDKEQKLIKKSIILLSILGAFWGCFDETPQTYKVKFAYTDSPYTPKGQATEFFAKRVGELSKGRIQVEISPNAQSTDDDKIFQELMRNNVQMSALSLSKFAPMAQEFNVWDIPFLFANTKHIHRVMDGSIGQNLKEIISKRGLVALTYWDGGFKQLSTNQQAITLPEDLKGQKIGITNSKVLEEQFKALGAHPQIFSLSEVYSALSSSLINGAENHLSNFYTSRFYEVQSSLTLTNHGYLGYLVVVNDGFWKQLPEDLKKVFLQALNESSAFERKQSVQAEKEFLAKLKKLPSDQLQIITLNNEQKKQWKETLRATYPAYAEIVGQELIDEILSLHPDTDSQNKNN